MAYGELDQKWLSSVYYTESDIMNKTIISKLIFVTLAVAIIFYVVTNFKNSFVHEEFNMNAEIEIESEFDNVLEVPIDDTPAVEIEAVEEEIGKFVICIDPGHQSKENKDLELISPYSDALKGKVSPGTRGIHTGTFEHEINLSVALLLRDKLINEGYEVVLTRSEADVNISNKERAEISNSFDSDIFIRLHADQSAYKYERGISVLYPLEDENRDVKFYEESKLLGSIILEELLKTSGLLEGKLVARSDITGFNWSNAPVVLVEMGFMSNKEDDLLLNSYEYQMKIVNGITKALEIYFGND